MLNFDEEIMKFKPSLEVDKIQKNIKNDNMGDLLDIVKQLTALDITKSQNKNKAKG